MKKLILALVLLVPLSLSAQTPTPTPSIWKKTDTMAPPPNKIVWGINIFKSYDISSNFIPDTYLYTGRYWLESTKSDLTEFYKSPYNDPPQYWLEYPTFGKDGISAVDLQKLLSNKEGL